MQTGVDATNAFQDPQTSRESRLADARIKGMCSFVGIDEQHARRIIQGALCCIEGIRDLDLTLDAKSATAILSDLGLKEPITYISLRDKFTISQETQLRNLEEQARTAPEGEGRELVGKIKDQLTIIDRNKRILGLSFSAVELGLFRGLQITEKDGKPSLTVKFAATSAKCLHLNTLSAAFVAATQDLCEWLITKGGVPNLGNQPEIQYLEGVWRDTDMAPEILGAAAGKAKEVHQSLASLAFGGH